MQPFHRRQFLQLAAGLTALPAAARNASAQAYPSRPVRVLVGFAAGSAIDISARLIGQWLSEHLGQPFVVENRPSATGTLGLAQMAATAKPDGYTITQIHAGALRLPFMTKTSYDPATDFTYIIGISALTAGLVVRSDAPWKTFAELLADAKANPGKISYGSPSGASNPPVVMRLVARRLGAL